MVSGSAIIALQQSSAIPLENQKRSLYRLTEELGMIWLDYVLNYYDSSRLIVYQAGEEAVGVTLDLERLRGALFHCQVRAGASAYWSEMATLSTLDKLLAEGHIDFAQYLERLPEGFIPDKAGLLEKAKQSKGEEHEKDSGVIQ